MAFVIFGVDIILNPWTWVGIGITAICIFFLLSELFVYFRNKSSSDKIVMWSAGILAGVLLIIFQDPLLGAFSAIAAFALWQAYELKDVPVWGRLMIASTISYLVIVGGKVAQLVFNYYGWTTGADERIFGLSWIIAVYVFFAVAFLFFGKRFIIVSRLSSPQMIYLFIFAIVYFLVSFFDSLNFNYFGVAEDSFLNRIPFATFEIYEVAILLIIVMYLSSGVLLSFLFGVKPVKDGEVIKKVHEVGKSLGIHGRLKIGFVKVPILNAFAYGPFFDKRIAFMAKDLDSFSDSSIRGIAGHELAHASKHHTLYLMLLSVIEVAVKKFVLLPATILDFVFFQEGLTVTLFQYLLINYVIVIGIYIFVRALEGHADLVTKRAGYGKDLVKSLFRLEGFYQGVAADFGISVHLLTNKSYSKAEREKYSASAGRELYLEFLNPRRLSALANIIASHPRTSYRVAALIREDISPITAAFLPYRILGMFKRKSSIKLLRDVKEKAKKILDETYLEDFSKTALKEVQNYYPFLEPYKRFEGKNVIAHNLITSEVSEGKLTGLTTTNTVTTPVKCKVGEKEIYTTDYLIRQYAVGKEYVLKDGKIFTPSNYAITKKKEVIIAGDIGSKKVTVKMPQLGVPKKFFDEQVGNHFYFYKDGSRILGKLIAIEGEESWRESSFLIEVENEEKKLRLKEVVLGFLPFGIQYRKSKSPLEVELIQSLQGERVILYTKDNYDIATPGILKKVDEKSLVLQDKDGEHTFSLRSLEMLFSYENSFELYQKSHLSIFDKIGFWFNNRKEFTYVNV